MFCEKCGAENRNDRKFCANCGAPLKDYTKPKTNLIMPSEIEANQQRVKKRNRIKLISSILMFVFFVFAVALTIVSFFIKNNWFWVVIGLSFGFYVALLITYIVSANKTKKLKNK